MENLNLKGTKSEENLKKAFAGESQARARYFYFAEQARKDGLGEVADLFEKMAVNETAHAKVWFQMLNSGKIPPADKALEAAMRGENEEWTSMYKQFAADARSEGLDGLAKMFERVADVECDHEKLFLTAWLKLKNMPVPEKKAMVEVPMWRCSICGHLEPVNGKDSPYSCPLCGALGTFQKATVEQEQ